MVAPEESTTRCAQSAAGSGDDPRLDHDAKNGFGPENVNIDYPELNANYRVGAYYYSGTTPANVTIKIYCGGVVKAQLTHDNLTVAAAPKKQLWKAADVKFSAISTCTVTPIDTVVAMDAGGVER